MDKLIYIILRLIYFVGPFLIGAMLSRIAIHHKERVAIHEILVPFLFLLTLAASIMYSIIYPGTSANVAIVYLISFSAGIVFPGWWHHIRKMLSNPEMRYLKIFIFLYLACCIFDHIPYEISSFVILAIFSLMGLGIWELKLWFRSSRKLLDDEI